MSSQSELNNFPYPFILYYCGFIHEDPTVYQLDVSDVCYASYNEFSGNLQIDTWYILGYAQPSMATLMTYTLLDVLTWYFNFYQLPISISSSQFYKISSANLALCRVDTSMIGYCVFDTTLQKNRKLNSSMEWVDA